ncbi:MAG: hypothetical protein ABFS02_10375 [Pseudomonadota bacterium]
MQTKQWVGVAAFGLVFGFAGLVQAGGVTDLKSGAVGAIRESVHEQADGAMDNVGLKQEQQAAEGNAATEATAESQAATGTAEPTAVEGDVAKDATVEGEAVKEPAEAVTPKPSAEDAAKDALKGLLD